ncbi:MAG TPA: CRISPR-associated endonuclease Cas2 [Ignavibacteria bacterium]|nr:CRISPR-associated endonuclease Cas2 [Ignavibacteria bacterium]
MIYIIIFKISDKRNSRNINKLLLAYGEKIKSGVFECQLSTKYYNELSGKLKFFANTITKKDFIKTYVICGKCSEKIVSIGALSQTNDALYYIV